MNSFPFVHSDVNKRMTDTDVVKINNITSPPPGISVVKFNNHKAIYNIIHAMFEKLNIYINNHVLLYGNELSVTDSIEKNETYQNYFKRIKQKNKSSIFCKINTDKIGVFNILDNVDISTSAKNKLIELFRNTLKLYFEKKDFKKIDSILKKARLFFIKYKGNHGGHRLHTDDRGRNGPVFIYNLGYSTIDYVPFMEIASNEKEYTPYRYNIVNGDVFIMDGDSRSVYYHGVPPKKNEEDYLRYAILLRVKSIYKKNTLCPLTNKYFLDKTFINKKYSGNYKFKCNSDTENIKGNII